MALLLCDNVLSVSGSSRAVAALSQSTSSGLGPCGLDPVCYVPASGRWGGGADHAGDVVSLGWRRAHWGTRGLVGLVQPTLPGGTDAGKLRFFTEATPALAVAALLANRFPESLVSLSYTCEETGDAGVVSFHGPFDAPQDRGEDRHCDREALPDDAAAVARVVFDDPAGLPAASDHTWLWSCHRATAAAEVADLRDRGADLADLSCWMGERAARLNGAVAVDAARRQGGAWRLVGELAWTWGDYAAATQPLPDEALQAVDALSPAEAELVADAVCQLRQGWRGSHLELLRAAFAV